MIAGEQTLDGGVLKRRDGLRIAHVEQSRRCRTRRRYARASPRAVASRRRRIPGTSTRGSRHSSTVSRSIPTSCRTACRAGERKRAALALAFALDSDLLLLDEPTNHLDIDAIVLLEGLLAAAPASIVITHDRAFLDRVVTRIVELDRGELRSYPGQLLRL